MRKHGFKNDIGSRLHFKHTDSSLRRSFSNSRSRSRMTSDLEISPPNSLIPSSRSFVHTPSTTKNSSRYYSTLKTKIFNSLYSKLTDSKSCTEPVPVRINSDILTPMNVSRTVLKILKPVLEKVKNTPNGLSKKNFIMSCLKLYPSLDQVSKNTLLKLKTPSTSPKRSSKSRFSPRLSKNSRKIVKQQNGNISERLYKLHEERRYRLLEAKKIRDRVEMEQCTFHPMTSQTSRKIFKMLNKQI